MLSELIARCVSLKPSPSMLVTRSTTAAAVSGGSEASERGARTITVADISKAMTCTLPAHKDTTREFCVFVHMVAAYGGTAGCDAVIEARALPMLFSMLECWAAPRKQDADVIQHICAALRELGFNCSEQLKLYLRECLGDGEWSLLLAVACLTGLDGGNAVTARIALGLPMWSKAELKAPWQALEQLRRKKRRDSTQ